MLRPCFDRLLTCADQQVYALKRDYRPVATLTQAKLPSVTVKPSNFPQQHRSR